MTTFRRRLARVLARCVVLVNPDPPLKFTTRRIEDWPVEDHFDRVHVITSALNGSIGGQVGLGKQPPSYGE